LFLHSEEESVGRVVSGRAGYDLQCLSRDSDDPFFLPRFRLSFYFLSPQDAVRNSTITFVTTNMYVGLCNQETRLALLADIRTIRKEMGVLSHDLS
jgi:hypothetical protein